MRGSQENRLAERGTNGDRRAISERSKGAAKESPLKGGVLQLCITQGKPWCTGRSEGGGKIIKDLPQPAATRRLAE